jgi:hypothetical protein
MKMDITMETINEGKMFFIIVKAGSKKTMLFE